MMLGAWLSKRWIGLLVGFAVTAAGCAAWQAGWLLTLNQFGLDLHFRHLSSVEPDPRIVMIDIDDQARRAIAGWPWPRRLHAELIDVLSELGAHTIILDIVFDRLTEPRFVDAGQHQDYDVDSELPILGEGGVWVYDDEELAAAMARAGNVHLAMLVRLAPPGVDMAAVIARGIKRAEAGADLGDREFARELGLDPTPANLDLLARLRLAAALIDDLSLDAEELAKRFDPAGVTRHLTTARRLATQTLAMRYLQRNPEGTWAAFRAEVLPGQPPEHLSPKRTELLRAFRAERAMRFVLADAASAPSPLRNHIRYGYSPSPPIDRIAEAARGVGFVTFDRQASQGVVRDLPLLLQLRGKLIPQLGLAAGDLIGLDFDSVDFDDGALTWAADGGVHRIGLSEDGAALVNWHVADDGRDWLESFTHVPAARIIEIAHLRSSIAQNHDRRGMHLATLVRARHRDTSAACAAYETLVRDRNRLRADRRLAKLPEQRADIDASAAELTARIDAVETGAIEWLEYQWGLWEHVRPTGEDEAGERARIDRLRARFLANSYLASLDAANERMSQRIDALVEDLGPQIQGKLCIVGYTAAAEADMVPTAAYDAMPGSLVHANVANMVLQNRYAQRAPAGVNLLLIAAAGMLITILTNVRGPLLSLSCLLVVNALILGIAGALFHTDSVHVASVVAVLIVCICWAVVTAYRQFTEERTRRALRRALRQYTSPAVAARIAGDFPADGLKPKLAEVTCFFCDLRGFTALSERLGPQRTRQLLNPYLGRVSTVLIKHGALVNKFIGDAIFAFFNAPIWPCQEHAKAACHAAVATIRALAELNHERAEAGDREPLQVKVGLATGEGFVGDYGSDDKLDYTCISDTVNVSSRLERANRPLGTSILVDDVTRHTAGKEFAFRSIGRLRLSGKRLAVSAYELLGLADDVGRIDRQFADRCAEAIGLFQQREWEACEALLARCRKHRPADVVVQTYRTCAARHRQSPPPDDWDGAIIIDAK